MSPTAGFCPKCSQPISIGGFVIAKCGYCGALTLSNDIMINKDMTILNKRKKMKHEIKKMILIVCVFTILIISAFSAIVLTLFPVIRFHLFAALGDIESMKKLSSITHEFKWTEQACAAGDSNSCWAIWNCYQGHDNQKAFEYLKKGAILELKNRNGYPCLLELTRVHEYGLLGQPRNPAEAERIRKQWHEIHRELCSKGMIL